MSFLNWTFKILNCTSHHNLPESFIHSSYKYLLRTYSVLGTVPIAWNLLMNKTEQDPCPPRACITIVVDARLPTLPGALAVLVTSHCLEPRTRRHCTYTITKVNGKAGITSISCPVHLDFLSSLWPVLSDFTQVLTELKIISV